MLNYERSSYFRMNRRSGRRRDLRQRNFATWNCTLIYCAQHFWIFSVSFFLCFTLIYCLDCLSHPRLREEPAWLDSGINSWKELDWVWPLSIREAVTRFFNPNLLHGTCNANKKVTPLLLPILSFVRRIAPFNWLRAIEGAQ